MCDRTMRRFQAFRPDGSPRKYRRHQDGRWEVYIAHRNVWAITKSPLGRLGWQVSDVDRSRFYFRGMGAG